MNVKMKKRANIPITILVMGVAAICMLVIGAVFYMDLSAEKEFFGVGVVENVNVVADEVSFQQLNSDFSWENYESGITHGNVKITVLGDKVTSEYQKNGKTLANVIYTKP